LWKVANLVRKADLTVELEEIKRRQLPVVVLWGDKDSIIPRASFDALCAAIGSPGEVVDGTHSWLLADPDAFAEVMTNVVEVARMASTLNGSTLNDGSLKNGKPGTADAQVVPAPSDAGGVQVGE
ncbi:MAG: hypothetical protein QOG64_1195, partial [Acidimicrobiaceae bacterium]|nr:hypothetical protein [Acidimicrobiaceae bacterium]